MQLDATVTAVIADAELEGVEDLSFQRVGELGEPDAQLWDGLEDSKVSGATVLVGLRAVGVQLGEGRAALVLKGVAASPDALAELRGGLGVAIVVGSGQLVEEQVYVGHVLARPSGLLGPLSRPLRGDARQALGIPETVHHPLESTKSPRGKAGKAERNRPDVVVLQRALPRPPAHAGAGFRVPP